MIFKIEHKKVTEKLCESEANSLDEDRGPPIAAVHAYECFEGGNEVETPWNAMLDAWILDEAIEGSLANANRFAKRRTSSAKRELENG